MKIGLYKLECPKHSSQGWFFIIDTSIQMGPQKCVVVLGVRKLDINKNFSCKFEDVEPLAISPLYRSPGEVINEVLEKAVVATGVAPIAIISDAGSENTKGVSIFSQTHPETIHLFDISHKINSSLKHELNTDQAWLAFKTAAAASIQILKLSSIAHLAPPRQRSKDRMHSAFYLIEWGLSVLQFIDSDKASTLTEEEKNKIEWIRAYQFSLSGYMCLKTLCEEALNLVHEKGYYLGVGEDFFERTQTLCLTDKRGIQFRLEIKKMLDNKGQKVPNEAHYLGSSEVLESLFGKFKAIEGDHASSGLSSLVLAIPALVGRLDETILIEALKNTSVSDVDRWNRDNLGETFLSKRRNALNFGHVADDYVDLDLCDF